MHVTDDAAARLLRLATAGSVDNGKSTLVGRLLLDTGSVFTDHLEGLRRGAATPGAHELDLSLLTDGLRAEREQGITIDVAFRHFATAKRRFLLADTPGHVQYNRNTVTGMSSADAAVVLVDVQEGLVEQARRHLAVAALLRVAHVVVALNKMDTVGFAESRFEAVRAEILAYAGRLGLDDVVAIPVSALEGDNIAGRSPRMPWYEGPALLEHLEQIPVAAESVGAARLPVQVVLRADGSRRYAGRLSSGGVQLGDEIVVLPSGVHTRVAGIFVLGRPVDAADPGQSVEIELADHVDVARGDLLAGCPAPTLATEFDAVVCCVSERKLVPGERVLVKHGTRTVRAIVGDVLSHLDLSSLRYVASGPLGGNDIGIVSLRTAEALPIERYRADRTTGSFLLVDNDDGTTIAAGMAGLPTTADHGLLPASG